MTSFIKLSKTCPGSVCIFCIFKRIVFVVLLQHLLMVLASSAKSNHSMAKATCVPFKTGPPAKKAVTISMAKTKQLMEQSNKIFFLPGCNMSDIEVEQMKTGIIPRPRVSVFLHGRFVLFM